MSWKEKLDISISTLPNMPGVYRFFNSEGIVIYVGKAKDLKKRVSSYFSKRHSTDKNNYKYGEKIDNLVARIREIKYVIVDSEEDAFLLENSLIKELKPRYNALLKDDKSYPYIVVKREPFPRVFITRKKISDGSTYFGPYSSMRMVRNLMELIKRLFPIRTCNNNLSSAEVASGRYKVCLEYHIKNCKAPCIGEQTRGEYDANIAAIKGILKGRLKSVLDLLKEDMQRLSDEFRFEEAQEVKQKYSIMETYSSKSVVVSSTVYSADVFSIEDSEDKKKAFIGYLKIVDGAIIFAYNTEIKRALEESKEELLSLSIIELRKRFKSDSKEVIVPFEIDFKSTGVKVVVPKIGDKHSLIKLVEKNVKIFKLEQKKAAILAFEERGEREDIVQRMKRDLNLKSLPKHIECFDNSNIQGHYPVAACVVFRNGKPSNKEYRHFHIKTVEGPNDFASMEEVVYRRYKSMLESEEELPDLIIVDGGKGQLHSAMLSLEKLAIVNRVEVIGIAKRLEEIFKPGDSFPLYVNKRSPSLKVIQHLRDEAHRFGITFHRDVRSKGFIASELDLIKGIGPKTRDVLMNHFKSVDVISEASFNELSYAIGKSKAEIVSAYFKNR